MPLLARNTQGRNNGVISDYLLSNFGNLSLRDLTTLLCQGSEYDTIAPSGSEKSRYEPYDDQR